MILLKVIELIFINMAYLKDFKICIIHKHWKIVSEEMHVAVRTPFFYIEYIIDYRQHYFKNTHITLFFLYNVYRPL